MQAYIKYEAYYDEKANSSKLKEWQQMYLLQPKAVHQQSEIPCTDFRRIGPYIFEKVSPKNNYLTQNVQLNKIQVLHCMRLRMFTPRQPIPDVQTTSQERKHDPKVILRHDDLYAGAWVSEYETPIFDNA